MYPTCMSIISFNKIAKKIADESALKDQFQTASKNYLMALGTNEGKIVVYRINANHPDNLNKLYSTKAGLAYGAITAIDISTSPSPEFNTDGNWLVATTETGEVHQFELIKKLNEE